MHQILSSESTRGFSNTNVYQVAMKARSNCVREYKKETILLQKYKYLAETTLLHFSIGKCWHIDQLIPITLKKLNIAIIGQMYMNMKYTISNLSAKTCILKMDLSKSFHTFLEAKKNLCS